MMRIEKKNRPTRLTPFLLVACLLCSMPLRAEMFEDMLALEQRFIPAWLMTSEADSGAAVATDALIEQWHLFKQQHAYRYAEDTSWGFELAAMEQHLLDARRLNRAGRYPQALAALREVRDRLIALRERRHIDFYIDELVRFDDTLQALQARLQQGQADAVYTELSDAQNQWQLLAQRQVNLHEYGLGLKQISFLQGCLQKGQQLLAQMQSHYGAAEYDAIRPLAEEMRQVYRQSYAIFAAP